ncbi:MAG: hypothetical protein H7A20_01230 [Rhodanobacteraceae bacterium]|nr:hypothetical protein [Xanthomonadales bacterium]MCP5477414.1 hypothetical protein [Rhodanobacteraceae bacterium]HPF73288.1 hypothetical protein [Xanthomonadaceae bacterium]HRX99245.1 hypothetical protein [Xanthomonadaceae bacterium]
MPRQRSPIQRAAGKLTSAIQKEWGEALGKPGEKVSEEVMHNSHRLLQAAAQGRLKEFLGDGTVGDFLGRHWVHAHSDLKRQIQVLQDLLDTS